MSVLAQILTKFFLFVKTLISDRLDPIACVQSVIVCRTEVFLYCIWSR